MRITIGCISRVVVKIKTLIQVTYLEQPGIQCFVTAAVVVATVTITVCMVILIGVIDNSRNKLRAPPAFLVPYPLLFCLSFVFKNSPGSVLKCRFGGPILVRWAQ